MKNILSGSHSTTPDNIVEDKNSIREFVMSESPKVSLGDIYGKSQVSGSTGEKINGHLDDINDDRCCDDKDDQDFGD
jgi:hypothetical protein